MSRFSKNPFDDDEEGGFGGSSSRGGPSYGSRGGVGQSSRGRAYDDDYGGGFGSSSSRGQGYGSSKGGSSGYGGSGRSEGRSYQPTRAYSDQDYGSGYGRDEPPLISDAEFQERKQVALRKMEDSSFNSLRTLHDCVRMGTETTEELERQAEALDRTEARLDEIHVGLDRGQQHLNRIKSPFGGIKNYFTKKKQVSEVTDPKGFKPSRSDNTKSGGKQKAQTQAQAPQKTYKSTGSEVVDRNLDLMGKALDDLHGLGELIGEQLDDSDRQIERIAYKVERDDVKMQKLNQGIKKELRK